MLAGVSLTDAAIETRFVAAGRRVSLLTSELADAQQTVSVARNAAKAKQDAALVSWRNFSTPFRSDQHDRN